MPDSKIINVNLSHVMFPVIKEYSKLHEDIIRQYLAGNHPKSQTHRILITNIGEFSWIGEEDPSFQAIGEREAIIYQTPTMFRKNAEWFECVSSAH